MLTIVKQKNQRKIQAMKENICQLAVEQLQNNFNQKLKSTLQSDEYKNFKDTLITEDSVFSALVTAQTNIKKSLRNANVELVKNDLPSISVDTPLDRKIRYYLIDKRDQRFPITNEYFCGWREYDRVKNLLEVYDNLKDADKIVQDIVKRLEQEKN